MNREAFLDKGERVFVLAISAVLALEVISTLTANGADFSLARLILGVFGSIFILYLGQGLYRGDRQIESLALIWAGLQILLMAASLAANVLPPAVAAWIHAIGTPGVVMPLLKLIAYAGFAASILMRNSTRAFLSQRRGEEVTHLLPATVVDDSSPLGWTADQTQVFASLANIMRIAALVLVLLGIYVVLNAIPPSLRVSTRQWLAVLEGVLIFGLGALLFAPAQALSFAGDSGASTAGRLRSALQHLAYWHLAVGAVGALLVVTVVVRTFVVRA